MPSSLSDRDGIRLSSFEAVVTEKSSHIRSGLRRYFAAFDFLQFGALLLLVSTGLIFIYSTGMQLEGSDPLYFFKRQILWISCGAALYISASFIDCRSLLFKASVALFYLGSLLALVLVLFIGVRVYGATRWLDIGGLRIQPSEFAKLATALMLAVLFSLRGFAANTFSGITISFATVLLPFLLIAAEPDFGSAVIFLPLFAAVIFAAGLDWKKILLAVIFIAIAASAAVVNEIWEYKPLLKNYQRERIAVFLDPERDPRGSGYNVRQAMLAVGSGGSGGKGIGEGTQNTLGFLPKTVSNNDFIFSVIAEETGFAGVTLLLLIFGVLLYSVLRTAMICDDPFGRYFCCAAGMIFFVHIFINAGMCIGIMPVTGLSLPFVSYGGSFIMSGMLSLGLIQAVRHTEYINNNPV